jgi:hypothetical protein
MIGPPIQAENGAKPTPNPTPIFFAEKLHRPAPRDISSRTAPPRMENFGLNPRVRPVNYSLCRLAPYMVCSMLFPALRCHLPLSSLVSTNLQPSRSGSDHAGCPPRPRTPARAAGPGSLAWAHRGHTSTCGSSRVSSLGAPQAHQHGRQLQGIQPGRTGG